MLYFEESVKIKNFDDIVEDEEVVLDVSARSPKNLLS